MALRNLSPLPSLLQNISYKTKYQGAGTWNVALEHLAKWHCQFAHTTQNVNFCL